MLASENLNNVILGIIIILILYLICRNSRQIEGFVGECEKIILNTPKENLTAPTTAPTPQREQAEQAPMVFNINFGGAVIYDTKRSAEQALADRITSLQNTRRRGAPRRF